MNYFDRSNLRRLAPLLALVAGSSLVPTVAGAQERFEPRFDAAEYPIEVEVHASFGAENVYGTTGFGAGLRLSVPVVAGMLGRRVSDNLAISFGGDILHYDNCYYSGRCGADYLMFPVAAQWNIFFGRRVSLFGEAGAFVYKGFFDGCALGDVNCSAPRDFGILPTLAVGARVHLGRNAAFIARLGYPTSTLGVSFL
jgi:hypothetical protein